MHKGVSFTVVWLLTTLSWVLVGYVIRLFFQGLSLTFYLTIGLFAGFLLASVLSFIHEDRVEVPTHTEPDQPSAPQPRDPAIRPNSGSGSQPKP